MSSQLLVALVLACFGTALAAAAPQADFFVAANGNDRFSGTLDAPNAAGADGPFATIERAQQAVRALRQKQGNAPKAITVMVRGGMYALAKPLQFAAEDSGAEGAATVYAAYPGETPVFSGGQVITGWKVEDGRWSVVLPEVKAGQWDFEQLWVGGQRRYRPRLPEQGYYAIADGMPVVEKDKRKGFNAFKFKTGEIRPDLANIADVEVIGFQVWTMARLRIASVDTEKSIVTFTGMTRSDSSWSALPKGHRYIIENVKEALKQPGQWYLDRPTGTLTYIPMPGEDPARTQVIAPWLGDLLHVAGDIPNKRWASHIIFRGLTFAYTNWACPPEGNNFPQAEINLSAAVVLSGARNCAMENCTVKSVATYAIDFAAACQNNRVEGCDLLDMGAGGVKIGLTRVEKDPELLTGRQVIRENTIAHGGRLHPAAIGVWVGHSPANVIEHNDIFDLYYTGVSIGWVWGYAPSPAVGNKVLNNHIYDLGQGVLSDMGGIYTLGDSAGTQLIGNLIHDVDAFDYGGWGIYFDEGTTHILAENNLVYRTKTGGFHQHYGKENTVRNNIFAFAKRDQLQRTRPEEHVSFTFERNIVYWNAGPLLGSNWSGENYKLAGNLFWRADGKPIDFRDKANKAIAFDAWQQRGQDKDSIIADPLFVDPAKGDFRLKDGSPAAKIGFVPLDMSKAGRLTKSGEQPGAVVPAAFPTMESK